MRLFLGILLVVGLSACSGGGRGGQALPPSTGPANASTALTAATLKILVPKATAATSSQSRRPAYVSPSTQSMTVNVTPHLSQTSLPGFPLTVNLTPSSAGCTSTATGTVCNVALNASPGTYDATLATFDGMNAAGNQLSAAQGLPVTVVQNQANTISLVLGGTPASMTLVASGSQVTAAHLSVFTLPGSASGTLAAYGVDADGNTIVGAGGPTISATTDDATQIAVTQPTSSAPNAIGITSLGPNAIAHITATITPIVGAGGTSLSKTVTVQAPALPLLYVATHGVHVFDATGTEITPAGTAFAALNQGPGGVGIAYDSANGFLYAADQNGAASFVMAFDKNGNQQPLNSATNLPNIGGLTFDPSNGWIYAAGENFALDAAGNQHALNATLPFSYNPTYDPQHNVVVSGTQSYDPNGNLHGTLPFTGQVTGVTYSAANGWFYVATVYPTSVAAYDTNGNPQVLSGSFSINAPEQIGGIAADPVTGNIYLATNAIRGGNTYGFDRNGNALPPPWHTIFRTGAASGAAGLALAPP